MKRHVMEEKKVEYEIQMGQETANLQAQNRPLLKIHVNRFSFNESLNQFCWTD